ncbi:hypothetical protein [Methylobacterium sp. R2-1]|uniref:hypothetical protein n=1 Tax=Methylobacterium sp. R2-1 TaxID=2587064 RepID=UPI0017B32BF5|nr:hypothetical protein [Methylobacterium sp. R2-1]MBB2962609.1 hypothetical protein [Methylobacterium sp. R2-1]
MRKGAGAANNLRIAQSFADAGFSGIKQDLVACCAAACRRHLEACRPRALRQLRSAVLWSVGVKKPVLSAIATKKRAKTS